MANLSSPEPAPIPNNHPAIMDLVINDMIDRDAVGKARYGVRLQPFNGRDALKDAYNEGQDLVVYLRQAIYERDEAEKKARDYDRLKASEARLATCVREMLCGWDDETVSNAELALALMRST